MFYILNVYIGAKKTSKRNVFIYQQNFSMDKQVLLQRTQSNLSLELPVFKNHLY